MKNLNGLDWLLLILLIIGGLNWGLVGLFDFNLVEALFGSVMIIAKIIYIVVGVSAVYILAISGKLAKK
ncbi:MAG: DUF378 domain-containing protein [Patescibacteria group bacterium]